MIKKHIEFVCDFSNCESVEKYAWESELTKNFEDISSPRGWNILGCKFVFCPKHRIQFKNI